MHYPARGAQRERHTLCISSQAGCAVGCPFCATGELGFTRDLETAEIVDQVRHAARRLAADGKRLTNVVFMGMGEPLLNLDRVLESVDALNDPAAVRPRGAAHHGLDERCRAGHPAPDRARAAVHARRLAPRRARCAPRRPRAAEPALAGRRGRRGGPRPCPRDGPAGELRDDDDLGRERHGPRRRGDGRPAPRRPRPRQPHPDEPGRAHAVGRQPERRHRAVRRDAQGRRHRDHDPAQPRRRRSGPRAASSRRSGQASRRQPPSRGAVTG